MRIVILASSAILLCGCATPPPPAAAPPPDLRAMLLAPCANAADTAPWLLVDSWSDGDTYEMESRFRDDGVMIYAYDGATYDNGRWSIDGKTLRIDTNNHYADLEGEFDGQSGSGVMRNTEGDTGTWMMSRDCDG